MSDIIERLQDDEKYMDAIDDAIAEIERLRRKLKRVEAAIAEAQESFNNVFEALLLSEIEGAMKDE